MGCRCTGRDRGRQEERVKKWQREHSKKAGRKRWRHPCGASVQPGTNKTFRESERLREGHNNIQCETGRRE